jgi:hypothetical protein
MGAGWSPACRFKLPKKMHSIASLTDSHRRTYEAIFQHPASHNLAWHDVHALFRQLCQVEQEPNGSLKMTRRGQILVLHPPRTKEVAATEELMSLRHFLKRSETPPPGTKGNEAHWLLVIDHREARIFHSVAEGTTTLQILPHEPEDHFRHTHNSKDFSRGQEKPDPNSFFEPVAKALQAPGQILVFGTGTGTSSEMDQFIAWTRLHHPDLAQRIIGSLVVDEHHLTKGQLLAKAREFHANVRTASA